LIACGAGSPAPAYAPSPSPSTSTPTSTSTSTPTPTSSASADAAFAAIASRFLTGYLRRSPSDATQLGEHRYDDQWPDLSAAGEADLRSFLGDVKKAIADIRRDALSDQNQVDARILDDRIDGILFRLDEIRDAEDNPVFYTTIVGDGLDPLVTREFAPLRERMTSLRARLLGVPLLVAVAKGRLKNPPRVHTDTAIQQTKGLVALCDHELAAAFAGVPDLRPDLETAARTAAASLRELQAFFEKELAPRSTGSFRMGAARFAKILHYDLEDEVDPDVLVTDARVTMDHTLDEMVETTRELWPTLMTGPVPNAATPEDKRAIVRRVLTKLGDESSEPRTILADGSKQLADATRFVAEHDLVRVPSEPCRVIEMPEYRRGVAIAYCESSGPLERRQETFYAISPAPRSWSATRVASFYREYNKSMLVDLTVHEAMPGHYLQAMHANAFRSDVRAVFSNGAFVEGWASYGEWLMAKYGFGGPKARLQRLKMLMRVCANVLLDHGIHAGAMEEKDALALMTGEAFQEEGEAVGKWTRARLTSGQISTYFYGYREFMKLREAAEKAPGFRERAYNDRLIAFGAPPMRDLRWLLTR
jgi:hypothetical protein